MFDEQKRLYPNGKPPFSLTPLKRAEEFVPTSDELSAQVKNNDVAIITLGRTSGEASDRRVEEFYLKKMNQLLLNRLQKLIMQPERKLLLF